MRRLPLILIAAVILFFQAASIHAATVSISNNHNSFGKGDTLTTTISVTHSGSPVTVDAYLALVLPDRTLIFFEENNGLVPHPGTTDPSSWTKLVSNVTLTDSFNTGPIPIFTYTVTGTEQPGIYQWIFGIAPAGTLNALDIKSASFFVSLGPPAQGLEPGQAPPTRLFSIGDSITRAFDANLPLENPNLSWVNGFTNDTTDLFGLPDVHSHNERISANFGDNNRLNDSAAENGARMDDMAGQASVAAGRGINYATVMLGDNDVCQATVADIPTDAEFEQNFRLGMDTLLAQLAPGGTILITGIIDVARLHDVGMQKAGLAGVDCPTLWEKSGVCGSVLSAQATDADRANVHARTLGFNSILQRVSGEYQAAHPDRFISYTDSTFQWQFGPDDVSDIDCFHPSTAGQTAISRMTWDDGPFRDAQAQ